MIEEQVCQKEFVMITGVVRSASKVFFANHATEVVTGTDLPTGRVSSIRRISREDVDGVSQGEFEAG